MSDERQASRVPHAGSTARADASSQRAFDQYRDTPLWKAVEAPITELVATRELSMNTAPSYVIGYLCQELVAKKLVAPAATQK